MIKIYNTLTRSKEIFKPLNPGKVMIYACGPTVYNYIHLGNARPICTFDVLRRFFEYVGYEVTYVQNFTDVDDKIIKKANEEKINFMDVSAKYIEEYKKDAKGLNVKQATFTPKATENIAGIIRYIEEIIEKGFGYEAENGDVYFRARRFKNYGKFSHQTLDDLQSGARIKVDEIKEDPLDFALWKAAKPGEPYWESPWGKGRPGWHIECSVMSQKYLGKTIDIHCGGQDLIFPHHENEIAQSECLTNVPLANYWMHNGYINIDNQKMSKSLNNFFTVRQIAEEFGYEPIRYLMLSSHYRSPINFSEDVIKQCKAAIERLYTFRENLKFAIEKAELEGEEPCIDLKVYKERFIQKLSDDLNTADALGIVFELVKEVNTSVLAEAKFKKKSIKLIIDLFDEFMDVLGILYEKNSSFQNKNKCEIESLITLREQARLKKDWKLADEIRDKLKSKGVVIEDTPQGTKFTFK